jgi:hypothetical protein
MSSVEYREPTKQIQKHPEVFPATSLVEVWWGGNGIEVSARESLLPAYHKSWARSIAQS